MPENDPSFQTDELPEAGAVADLRARAEALERQLEATRAEAERRLVHAELKTEAVRAGMVDLDGLKLIDTGTLKLGAAGGVDGAASVMAELKRAKPWLFAGASSSTSASPPPSTPPRTRHASEMTDDEWRSARADLLRRRF
jgi:hypothetical protein